MNFEKKTSGNIVSLTCVGDIDHTFSEMIVHELLTMDSSVALDLQQKYTITKDAFRELVPCALEMKKKFRYFYLVNATKDLKQTLSTMGLHTLLKCIGSLKEAEPISGPKTLKKLDVNFLNPFIEGTILTFDLQCSTECRPQKLIVKDPDHYNLVDIAGVIGITSQGFNGSISICFPEKTFIGIVSSMLGEEYTEITKDVEDAAGEILNIIFGHAKKKLNEEGYSFQKAIPTVVRGNKFRLKHMQEHVTFVLPFETKFGMFFIEISAEKDD